MGAFTLAMVLLLGARQRPGTQLTFSNYRSLSGVLASAAYGSLMGYALILVALKLVCSFFSVLSTHSANLD